jgi:hypothetical protein
VPALRGFRNQLLDGCADGLEKIVQREWLAHERIRAELFHLHAILGCLRRRQDHYRGSCELFHLPHLVQKLESIHSRKIQIDDHQIRSSGGLHFTELPKRLLSVQRDLDPRIDPACIQRFLNQQHVPEIVLDDKNPQFTIHDSPSRNSDGES